MIVFIGLNMRALSLQKKLRTYQATYQGVAGVEICPRTSQMLESALRNARLLHHSNLEIPLPWRPPVVKQISPVC